MKVRLQNMPPRLILEPETEEDAHVLRDIQAACLHSSVLRVGGRDTSLEVPVAHKDPTPSIGLGMSKRQ